jgi:hypothetical protein
MQLPACALNWMDAWTFGVINIIGTAEDYISCGMFDDLANAEGTPPRYPHSMHPGEATYQLWKQAVDDMWISDVPLDAYQCLIEEHAALKLVATQCQCLLDECTAQEQRMVAPCTILLWICRRCLIICLARTTARWQQREAALVRLHYKQECCARAATVEEG